MKNAGIALLLVLGALTAYLLFWPVPIEPVAWTPPPAPALEGVYAENQRLKGIQRLAKGLGAGPEGVALDGQGRVYAGYIDGRLMRFDADGSHPVELANTGGRPLGTVVLADGSLIVADAAQGLLQFTPEGVLKVLSAEAEGVPFGFTDDVDVSADGETLYFTDASHKFGHTEVLADFMEHGPNGRFLSYHLPTGRTTVLARDLHFPNGVAVGPDDAYVLVTETAKYRILRYWLKGEKTGQMDVFADNLPGFPDNISYNRAGRFWCAIYSVRSPDLDALLPHPFLRKVVFRLPEALQPTPALHAFVLGFNDAGDVIANLQYAAPDAYAPITSAVEHGGWLYFGSLTYPALGRLPLSEALH
jgi:sugar lactone lactonase YvrE